MTWNAAVVGDIMLNRELQPGPALELLRDADVATANLEVPLSDLGEPADKPISLRAPPEMAAQLPEIGINLVSFANNHALDYGTAAFLDTIQAVEGAGVRVVGAGGDLDSALRPAVTEHGGTKVAWLGFASTLPPGFAAAPQRPGVAPIRIENSVVVDGVMAEEQPGTSPFVATRPQKGDLRRAVEAIGDARNQADVAIVHVHWGVPPGFAAAFQGELAQYQRPLAQALVDAGATVIVGHHPHCLHGIEVMGGSLVLYSVGHFVFHALADDAESISITRPGPPYRLDAMFVPELKETAVFLLHFEGDALTQLEVVPCILNELGESEIARGSRAASILERVNERSKELGSDLKVEGERGFLTL